jgi:predicted RNase H-like nuclease (RuvC/YqgF family)
MSDSQEEKIKTLIRKSGYKVEEAIVLLEVSKQTFYNNIRKSPLDQNFVKKLKDKLKIDIENSLTNKTNLEESVETLKKENESLKREIELLREMIELYKSRK